MRVLSEPEIRTLDMGRTRATTIVIAAALVLLLSACGTPQSRIDRSPALFAALPADQQALVRDGQIAIGMPEDAVRLALGAPDRVSRLTDADGVTTIWRYVASAAEPAWIAYPGPGAYGRPWGFAAGGFLGPGLYGPAFVGSTVISPHIGVERDRLRVSFVEGRVSAIEEALEVAR